MEKKKRQNTYTNKEYFKIIVVATTKEKAYSFSQVLSGNIEPQRGVFYSPYLKTQLIIFPRFISKLDHQATTVAVEALVIYLEDEKELKEIKEILPRYGQVPIKVIVSEFDATHLIDELGGNTHYINRNNEPSDIKDFINNLDKQELKVIKKYFEKYDTDKGGSIDSKEMSQIAQEMGQDPNCEEFRKGIMALDLNGDGQISLSEFIMWWKIGRQNIYALPKIYDMFEGIEHLLKKENFDLENYIDNIEEIDSKETEELEKIKNEDILNNNNSSLSSTRNNIVTNKSSQRILFRSPGVFKIKTRIEASLAIGAIKKQEMAINFLKQFTKNTGSAKANWMSILVPLNQRYKKLNPEKAKYFLDEFKDHCIAWGEKHMGSAFTSFARNLLVYETNSNENSVILAIRLKLDIEELFKSSLKQLISVLFNIQPREGSTWLKFKCHSNVDLFDAMNEDITLEKFLDVSELIIESSTYKDRLKSLYLSLDKSIQDKLSFLQVFFQPNLIDLELDCKLSEFVSNNNDNNDNLNSNTNTNSNKESHLNVSLKKFGMFLDFLKTGLTNDLLSCAENVEICFNAFDLFASFKIYTQKTFSD